MLISPLLCQIPNMHWSPAANVNPNQLISCVSWGVYWPRARVSTHNLHNIETRKIADVMSDLRLFGAISRLCVQCKTEYLPRRLPANRYVLHKGDIFHLQSALCYKAIISECSNSIFIVLYPPTICQSEEINTGLTLFQQFQEV